jgi:hypothetical protein
MPARKLRVLSFLRNNSSARTRLHRVTKTSNNPQERLVFDRVLEDGPFYVCPATKPRRAPQVS